MINWEWIAAGGQPLLMVLLTGLGAYFTLLLLARLAGLRSFAKMSSFDFAITVAMGSLLGATIIAREPPLLQGMAGLAFLFGIQFAISWLRRHTSWANKLVDNRPLLLMAGEMVIPAHLDEGRITETDLWSKLRLAGVTHRGQVLAAVLEPTGDVAVLIRSAQGPTRLDLDLFRDVRGAERLRELVGEGETE